MRPLNKGVCPTIGAVNKVVTDYTNWRTDLINRIGYYCAYCNMPLSHSLQVEHVIPKTPPPGYIPGDALAWDNMLLACGPCNNAKDNTPINFNDFYFPEENNTLLAFEIGIHPGNNDAAVVLANQTLASQNQIGRANATIGLLELTNIDRRPAVVDIRWKKRRKAIDAVYFERLLYDMAKGSPTYNARVAGISVATKAAEIGFFSLWFEEFQNEPNVMEALIDNNIIPGTAQDCFDIANNFQPVPRNPLNIGDPI